VGLLKSKILSHPLGGGGFKTRRAIRKFPFAKKKVLGKSLAERESWKGEKLYRGKGKTKAANKAWSRSLRKRRVGGFCCTAVGGSGKRLRGVFDM